MIEAIGDDPALADTSGDPDAMTSALLPAVDSRYDARRFILVCAYLFVLFFFFSCGMRGMVGMHA